MSEEIYQSIATAVMEGEEEEGRQLVQEALKSDLPPLDILHRKGSSKASPKPANYGNRTSTSFPMWCWQQRPLKPPWSPSSPG
jgi:hypothetical protein